MQNASSGTLFAELPLYMIKDYTFKIYEIPEMIEINCIL